MRSRVLAFSLLLAACGGKVAIDPTPAGHGGAGGAGADACGNNGIPIPDQYKVCEGDQECTIKFLYLDCCGKKAVVGIALAQEGLFHGYKLQCNSVEPTCACDPGPALLDDGTTTSNTDIDAIHVVCTYGQCTTELL